VLIIERCCDNGTATTHAYHAPQTFNINNNAEHIASHIIAFLISAEHLSPTTEYHYGLFRSQNCRRRAIRSSRSGRPKGPNPCRPDKEKQALHRIYWGGHLHFCWSALIPGATAIPHSNHLINMLQAFPTSAARKAPGRLEPKEDSALQRLSTRCKLFRRLRIWPLWSCRTVGS
jgi:hypothetical protein